MWEVLYCWFLGVGLCEGEEGRYLYERWRVGGIVGFCLVWF